MQLRTRVAFVVFFGLWNAWSGSARGDQPGPQQGPLEDQAVAPTTSNPPPDETGALASPAPETAVESNAEAEAPSPPAPMASGDASGLLHWGRNAVFDDGLVCVPQGAAVQGNQGYLACGSTGVWVCQYDADQGWQVQEVVPVHGVVMGVRLEHGRLQVDVVQSGSASLSQLRASPHAAAPPPCDAPRVSAAHAEGLVVIVRTVEPNCLRHRERVELLDPSGRVLSVARVHRAGGYGAKLLLGYHERIGQDAVASVRGTHRSLTSSRIAPLRGSSLWIARLYTRAFLGGVPSGGLVADASLEYAFKRKAFLRVAGTPLVLSGGDSAFNGRSGFVGAGSAVAIGGLDTRLFALGAGVGVSTVNDPGDGMRPGSGTTFPLLVRVGARDGLSLELRGDTTLFLSQLRFTAMYGRLNVPMSYRSSFQLRAGGGRVGAVTGELAFRMLARGNGGPGSLFVEWSIGGGSLFRAHCVKPSNASEGGFKGCVSLDDTTFNGALLGVGLERRF